jgi:hypothetical protein
MKDPYGLADSGLPPELAAQMMGLSKREALAQALLAQSQEELQAHPVKGRFQGAITPIQGAAKVVQALLAQKGVKDVTKEREEVAASRQRATRDALAQYEQARGTDPRQAIRAAASNPLLASHPLLAMDAKQDEVLPVGRSLLRRGTGEVVGSDPTVAEDRAARGDQARAAAEARLEELRIRSEDRRISQEERQAHQREMAQLVASLRTGGQSEPLQSVVGPDGRPVLVPRSQAAGMTPAGNRPEKTIPTPLQKELTEAGAAVDATTRFINTFKDEYGGKTITGNMGNVAGRIFGDDTGQSQWWQDYDLHQSQARNKLFGSALTAPELAAWEKSAINPRMDSNQIRANLKRQNEIEVRALDKLSRGAAAGGYNRDQIEAFTGRGVPDGQAPKAPAAAPKAPAPVEERKSINGKNYVKQNGQWFEE